MSHRNNPYREGIGELFDRYGISPEAVHGLVVAGHEGVPTSDEKLLRIASYLIPLAQEVVHREHEAAARHYDNWAYDLPSIDGEGWGGGLGRPPQSEVPFEDSSEALAPGFLREEG